MILFFWTKIIHYYASDHCWGHRFNLTRMIELLSNDFIILISMVMANEAETVSTSLFKWETD